MGIGGTVDCDKGKHHVFVKLYRFAGGQVICKDNGRLLGNIFCPFRIGKDSYHPLRNILNVSRPLFHIGVIHRGKHFRKIVCGDAYGVFRIDALFCDNIFNGIHIIPVIKHHLMDFKYGGVCLPHFHFCFLI